MSQKPKKISRKADFAKASSTRDAKAQRCTEGIAAKERKERKSTLNRSKRRKQRGITQAERSFEQKAAKFTKVMNELSLSAFCRTILCLLRLRALERAQNIPRSFKGLRSRSAQESETNHQPSHARRAGRNVVIEKEPHAAKRFSNSTAS
jgi:hypothetical protein